jgi:hypothetical protein
MSDDPIEEGFRVVSEALALIQRYRELEARGHGFTAEDRLLLARMAALLKRIRAGVSEELGEAVLTDAEKVRAVFRNVPPGTA